MSYTLQDDGFYHVPIVDLGTRLRDNFGLTIREHEAFDPVDNVHSPNSYHYHGQAIDVQDWRDDTIDGVSWRDRTGNLENLLQGSGAEVFGPNSGVAGHDTHLHLAADNGIFRLNQQQYDTLFGGNAGGQNATFASATPASPQEQPERAGAKEKAQDYTKMSKAQLDSAYDAMRSDPAKARTEGMKMHKAYFGKK